MYSSWKASRMMAVFLLGLVLLLVFSESCAAQFVPPLIIFGDSTVDTGNNIHINTTLAFNPSFPPYGAQHFGKPTGRFSNGRVWVDFICESAGVLHVPPYLQPDADHSRGVNFGSGGGGVLPEINEGMVLSLGTQLRYFTEYQEALYERWGSQQAKRFFSDAIYVISVGNNDYMGGYLNVPKLREQYTPQEFIALVISKIIEACEFLHFKGARKLVVLGVGPLGCVPALRQLHPTHGCFEPAGELGVGHNMGLRLALKKWESHRPDVTLLVGDLHEFMMARIKDPAAFGYVEGVAACCGSGPIRGGGPCGIPNPITGEDWETCDDPEDYVFWDFFHGSERLHSDFGKALWDGTSEVISPMSLSQLFELSSPSSCDDEHLGIPASPLDLQIERSSF